MSKICIIQNVAACYYKLEAKKGNNDAATFVFELESHISDMRKENISVHIYVTPIPIARHVCARIFIYENDETEYDFADQKKVTSSSSAIS